MKPTIFLLALLLSAGAFAQNSILAFYGQSQGSPNIGDNQPFYRWATQSDVNQSATGDNLVWDFSQLESNYEGDTYSYASLPDAGELAAFPGTTTVINTFFPLPFDGNAKLCLNYGEDAVYITGTVTNGIEVNFVTDNAFIGDFPLSYGYSNTDAVAGTFTAGTLTGTFMGTCNVALETGELIFSEDSPGTVIPRLKIVLDLNLDADGPAGTINQAFYTYYDEQVQQFPNFRSTTNQVSIPSLAIDETYESYEYWPFYLSAGTINNPAVLAIAPNPVNNILHIDGAQITGLTVTDSMGRVVLTSAKNDANISALSAGVYHVSVAVGSRVSSLLMVKQ